jgi:Mrp family chromosome partitioning ATPase
MNIITVGEDTIRLWILSLVIIDTASVTGVSSVVVTRDFVLDAKNSFTVFIALTPDHVNK